MDTSKFGLLIADDNEDTRKNYRNYLTEHKRLEKTWHNKNSIMEAKNAWGAIGMIETFLDDTDQPLIVISDAFMPPNCDGDTVNEEDKLFGGFKLIEYVNQKKEYKKRVKIILVTFYDDELLIQDYVRGDKDNFPFVNGIDYYFVPKPLSRNDNIASEDESQQKLKEADRKIKKGLYSRTIEAILEIVDNNSGSSQPRGKTSKIDSIVGESESIRKLKDRIRKVASTDRSILLHGYRGTGKDYIAEVIHSISKRKNKDMLTVNCAQIPQQTADSELFGHKKGSFTGADFNHKGFFEISNKKTIFLNEIGELSKPLQAKLLQVIEKGAFIKLGDNEETPVDVRIIAATNQDIYNQEKFRQDLRDRFNDKIRVPRLRERKEDIPYLVHHFQIKYNKEYKKNVESFQNVLPILKELTWPGNVRELEKAVEDLIFFVGEGQIQESDLHKYVKNIFQDKTPSSKTFNREWFLHSIKENEKKQIIEALNYFNYDYKKVEKTLGISNSNLYEKMNKYNIPKKRERNKADRS